MRMRWRWLAVVLGMLLTVTAVFAIDVNDSSFADWNGTANAKDSGSYDDERSPQRADITEFRLDADATNLYILMAWDDTAFSGGGASTAGVTIKGADGTWYRIYMTAQGSPGSVPHTTLDINRCSSSTCSSQSDVCAGNLCTGAASRSGTDWNDPFPVSAPAGTPTYPARSSSNCSQPAGAGAPACLNQDTAVELQIPWSLIGGVPTGSQYVFVQYNSYPSGPGNAAKDNANTPGNSNGLACRVESGDYVCYTSTPTAVTISSFSATPATDQRALLVGLLVLLVLGGVGRWWIRSAI